MHCGSLSRDIQIPVSVFPWLLFFGRTSSHLSDATLLDLRVLFSEHRGNLYLPTLSTVYPSCRCTHTKTDKINIPYTTRSHCSHDCKRRGVSAVLKKIISVMLRRTSSEWPNTSLIHSMISDPSRVAEFSSQPFSGLSS